MGIYDKEYKKQVKHILNEGVVTDPLKCRAAYEDGTPANTIEGFSYKMRFKTKRKRFNFKKFKNENVNEALILTTKRVGWKSSYHELVTWMWQMKSNNVEDLRKLKVSIWNEWEMSDGTIGTSYGWQLANQKRKVKVDDVMFFMVSQNQLSIKSLATYKLGDYIELDQVDYVLHQLQSNPESRRIYTTVRSVGDVDTSALDACVHTTEWVVQGNVLNLEVEIRSNDIALGQPFNFLSYQILLNQIAQVSNLEVGDISFNIARPHIYVDHVENITKQIKRKAYAAPQLKINPNVKSFYEFTIDDIELIDYKHHPQIKYRVGI